MLSLNKAVANEETCTSMDGRISDNEGIIFDPIDSDTERDSASNAASLQHRRLFMDNGNGGDGRKQLNDDNGSIGEERDMGENDKITMELDEMEIGKYNMGINDDGKNSVKEDAEKVSV